MSLADIQSMKALKIAKQNGQQILDTGTMPVNEVWISGGYFYLGAGSKPAINSIANYKYTKINNLKTGDVFYISQQSLPNSINVATLDVNGKIVRQILNTDSSSIARNNYQVVLQTNEVGLMVNTRSNVGDNPYSVKMSVQNTVTKLRGGSQITCIGDSLTYGAGATRGTNAYPDVLKTLTGMTVNNFSVGGEGSAQIAARHGGNPFVVAPFTIPADTSTVNITLKNMEGTALTTEAQGWYTESGINPCFINGVQGNINYASGSNNFSRITAGSSVTVTRPTIVKTDCMVNHLSDITIIWSGTNGVKTVSDVDNLSKYINAIINSLTHKKYIVIGLQAISPPNYVANSTDMIAINQELAKRYGKYFLDIYTYMINYGLQDAGIAATAQDTTDLSNGIIPTSLRYDSVHFNPSGYQVVAQQVYQRLQDLSYI
jgi:lysophospholipase L1-like esterase